MQPRNRIPRVLCLVSCLVALGAAVSAQEESAPEPGVEVLWLANEGFLVRTPESAVMIDGFLAEPYSIYGALGKADLGDLHAARGPFEGVDLALASHVHRDHFQAEPAQRFLAARPDCLFATSTVVLDAFWQAEAVAHDALPESSLRAVYPDDGAEEVLEHGGVRVTFLRLQHRAAEEDPFGNMGHVITLGGVTLLHVGDAERIEPRFAHYRLGERGIDVVFVPFWYFGDEQGRAIVERHFRPARLVACHIPPAELESVTRDLAASHPGVIVFQRPLEPRRFEDEVR